MITEKFIPALSPDGSSLQILFASVVDNGDEYVSLYEVKDMIGYPIEQRIVNETVYVDKALCFETVKEAVVYTLDEVTRRYEELDKQALNITKVEEYCIDLLGGLDE